MVVAFTEKTSLLAKENGMRGFGASLGASRHDTITKLSHAARRVIREDDFEDIELYVESLSRRAMFFIFSLVFLGLPYLFVRRNERVLIKLTHRRARYGDGEPLVVLVKRTGQMKWIIASDSQLVDPEEIRAFLRRVVETQGDILGDSYEAIAEASGDGTTMHGLVFEVQYRRYVLVAVAMDDNQDGSSSFLFDQSQALTEPEHVWILSRVEESFAPPTDDLFEATPIHGYGEEAQGEDKGDAGTGSANEDLLKLKDPIYGLNRLTVEDRLVLYGQNILTVRVPSVTTLFISELLHPFFLFQIFAVVLWLLEVYISYAVCILLTSLYSAFVEARDLHANSQRLAKLALEEEFVSVIRDGQMQSVSSQNLVPGDVMLLDAGMRMPCDGTLLSGAVLVNEASLTGESAPVRKNAWSPAVADLLTDYEGSDTSDLEEEDEERDEVLIAFEHEHGYAEVEDEAPSIPSTTTSRTGTWPGAGVQGRSAAAAAAAAAAEAAASTSKSSAQEHIEGAHTWARSEHVIYCGTNILDARSSTLVVVIRTRADTVRGDLVRDILTEGASSDVANDDMHRDSYAVIICLAIVGGICTVWAFFRFMERFGLSKYESVLNGLDLVTIALPPALPATVTFGLVFAIRRLQKRGIFVTRASAVTKAAWLTTLCFDKTGTLTEEGLDVRSLLLAKDLKFGPEMFPHNIKSVPASLMRLLASCHSLASVAGKVVGDEVDLKLFELSEWTLEVTGPSEKGLVFRVRKTGTGARTETDAEDSVVVRKLYPFNSELARMSVLAQWGSGDAAVFTKGAPERIASKCDRRTVPANLHEVLSQFTEQGFRVIALAERQVPSSSVPELMRQSRSQVERDLTFVGLAILENRLKEATTRVLQEFRHDARLRCVMVTGDHARTALSVARQCGILQASQRPVVMCEVQRGRAPPQRSSMNVTFTVVGRASKKISGVELLKRFENSAKAPVDLVVTGGAFRNLAAGKKTDGEKVLFTRILQECAVFARMSAADKALLIRLLKEQLSLLVGMCGDGANDAGALREASVGVALCGAEDGEVTASLAAPLTSRHTTIQSVTAAIQEGRAAAAASLAALKYMFLYSVVQLVSVTALYYFGSVLSDGEFLFVDLFLIIPLGVVMGQTAASSHLSLHRPCRRLTERSFLVSALGQSAIMVLFQLAVMAVLRYEGLWQSMEEITAEIHRNEDLIMTSRMVTAVFLFVNFQYLWGCLVFNLGPPFRRQLTSNRQLTLLLLGLAGLCSILTLHPPSLFGRYLQLEPLPGLLRLLLLALALLNLLASYLLEAYVNKFLVR